MAFGGIFRPPSELDFTGNIAQKWRTFKDEFDIFMAATGLDEKPQKRQVKVLLNLIGANGRAVYETFTFQSNEDNRTLKEVCDAFSDHCIPKQNELLERQIFRQRQQNQGETVNQFVSALKKLANTCNFGDAKDSVIRDQLVAGLLPDEKLADKLYDEANLSLERAVQICNTHELRQRREGKPKVKEPETVDALENQSRRRPDTNRKPRGRGSRGRGSDRGAHLGGSDRQDNDKKCDRCGYKTHKGPKCPAMGKQCVICRRFNHFASVCRSRMVHELDMEHNSQYSTSDDEYNDNAEDHFYVNALHTDKPDRSWKVKVKVEEHDCTFKIDTGSEVNTLPQWLFKKMKMNHIKLKPTTGRLTGYFGQTKTPLGTICAVVEYKGKLNPVEFYVVDAKKPVLGLRTCVQMGLIKRVNTLQGSKIVQKSSPQNVSGSKPVKQNSPKSHAKIVDEYNDVFQGLGCVTNVEYDLKLNPTVAPVVTPPRKVPYAMKVKLKKSLEALVKDGVIEPVTEPTEWVHPIIIVEKATGKLRLCLDPFHLNKAILRSHYPMRTIEDIAASLDGAQIFSVLDASQAFYQIKVNEQSSKLLTFNTAFGRYKFLRMPFGISSAPEIWERVMGEVFEGIEGVEIIRDEIMIKGKTMEEHNRVLAAALKRARERNIKFNKEKCEFGVKRIKHQGHIFSADGVQVDPEKVQAIVEYPTPTNSEEVRRFLGIVTYMGKFIPNLSKITQPLRVLLNEKIEWHWGQEQEKAMQSLKEHLTNAPILKFYSLVDPIVVTVDASTKGFGACLFQNGRPVHYASRRITPAEINYGQIDREMAGIVYGCEKFHDYIYGREDVTILTDHKPLEALYRKPLGKAPPRIQKMMTRLLKYKLKVQWTAGKNLVTADALSRAPIRNEGQSVNYDEYEIFSVQNLPIADSRLQEFRDETNKDVILQTVRQYVLSGWPSVKEDTPMETRPYWNMRDELYINEGLVLKDTRLVVPSKMRSEMLKLVHKSHLGVQKCTDRAKDIFFWPGMTAQVKEMCEQCSVCAEFKDAQRKEPMTLTQLPERPWQKAASDLFHVDKDTYVLVADYYSKFVEFTPLPAGGATSAAIIQFMKEQFARHGIPEQLITDGGPQYSSAEFGKFAKEYQFQHIMSSPEYPQSNGFAESQVKILKRIIKKCKKDNSDLYLAVLEWRNTPVSGLGSPTQISYGRRTRSLVPTTNSQLRPKPIMVKLTDVLADRQQKQKMTYDRHAGPDKEPLRLGEQIRMRTERGWMPGTVTKIRDEPRSYEVSKGGRTYRRNRRDIRQSSDIKTGIASHETNDQRQTSNVEAESDPSITQKIQDNSSFRLPERKIRYREMSKACNDDKPKSAEHGNDTQEIPRTTRCGRVINKPERYRDK
jgi:hypothetical protein